MSAPIYVYDIRTQFRQPLFVVYEPEHVSLVAKAIDAPEAEFLLESRVKLHPYEPNDPYTHPKKR